ncbi:APC family permease [Paludisphaera rhizosphaerae]|uniref:APC family permease n=1 Tax=Paludisphaera rhizosphaerae TaxID=2711216 RepID=UPI0013EAF856|nr:amino acid permease [Paludisphaera rhizosphaerae]
METQTISSPAPAQTQPVVLPRVLGPIAALCVVVGSVIGSGIFIVPARVAHELPFLGGIIGIWIVAGAFTTAGALTLAELGAMIPQAGGPYVYLREAYGKLPAFLFGWSELTVSRAGSMATLAAAFARYFAQIFPAPESIHGAVWQAMAAVSAITIVTFINVLGTKGGGGLQVVGTALKVGGVLTLIALPFIVGGGSVQNLSPWSLPADYKGSLFSAAMVAMVGVLWAYDGWMNVTPLAEEIRDPGRNIPMAMVLGMSSLVAIYLTMTIAYHYVLPMAAVSAAHDASSANIANAVAAVYCKTLLGANGVLAISALVMCSTFISLNGNALTGPRSYFAMARDGLLPAWFDRIHPRFQTPSNAIIAQAIWAITLTIVGTAMILVPPPTSSGWLPDFVTSAWTTLNRKHLYDILLDYVIFGATVFYMLAITSVFVLRKTRPDTPRPYKTWGYPFTPMLFVGASLLLLGSMLANHETRMQALGGGVLILLGVPAYYLLRRKPTLAESAG